MPKGDRQPTELLRAEAAWASEPALLAERLGHSVQPDHSRSAERWTCTREQCGCAVLRVGTNIYGSAVEERCKAGAAHGGAQDGAEDGDSDALW